MAADLMIPFGVAMLTFLFIPGPGNLFCSAQSLAFGTSAGLRAALGLHFGGYVHVLAASFGLSFVFEAVPALFLVMKLAGAAVLIWMGIALLRQRSQKALPTQTKPQASSFRRAFLVEALNPTTALFFLAFLPQFVSPEAAWPLWLQFLVLGTVVGLVFSITDVFYALAAGRLHNFLHQSITLQAWARRIGGTVLIALGVRVAASQSH